MIEKIINNQKLKKVLLIDVMLILLATAVILFEVEPDIVHGLKVVEDSYSSVSLVWNKTENAKGYKVFRSNDGNTFEYIATIADNKYEDKNLVTGRRYYYYVVAKNRLKTSDINKKEVAIITPDLDIPSLAIDTSEGVLELNYNEIEGANGYEVFRDDNCIGKTADLYYVDKDVKDDTAHIYSVRAYRYKKNTVYSKKSNTVKGEMQFIKDFSIEADNSYLHIKWDNSDYDNFKLYNGETLLTETSNDSFDFEDYKLSQRYDIKLVGFSSEEAKQSPATTMSFTVEEESMDNEAALDAVCKWAMEIAEDDSFHYGNGGAAHHNGCYFCNTQPDVKRRNVVQYEKTYCCNPFVQAAFAHGCGDPTMLGLCQRGGSYIEKNYRASPLFDNLGKPDKSSLQKGDVLCCQNGHVMLYVGDGNLCEAANGDDGKSGSRTWRDSISVSELSNNRWNNGSYGVTSVFRYNGTGSGTVHKIKEINNTSNSDNAA